MKRLLFCLGLVGPLGAAPAPIAPAPPAPAAAAPATPAAHAADEADPTLDQLEKLKPEQKEKIRKAINDASTFVGGIRLQEALQRLAEVEALAPDLFMLHNLKGAVFTKMRAFKPAREAFLRAEKLNPGSFHPRFNLAEIEFVEAAAKARAGTAGAAEQFGVAQKAFADLLESNADPATKKLMQFKVVICLLKQGKTADAEKIVNSLSYLDDEPAFYMSHAALEFNKGDKPAAQEWIDSANRVFSPQAVTIYMDSFIEIGWVETLAL